MYVIIDWREKQLLRHPDTGDVLLFSSTDDALLYLGPDLDEWEYIQVIEIRPDVPRELTGFHSLHLVGEVLLGAGH